MANYTSIINWSNVSDFGDLPSLANTATGNTFWSGIFVMLWVVLILSLLAFGWETALLAGSFGAMIIGLLLLYTDLIALRYLLMPIGVMLIMFLYIMWITWKNR